MFTEPELAILRRAFARHVAAAAGTADPRIVEALASLRREDFLPPGPWPLYLWSSEEQSTPDADPLFLYQDVAVPLLREKGLNSGVPSFVTRLVAAAGIRDGDRVIHVGTGTGYYTALMAHLAGPRGRILGIEREPTLARRAAELLAPFPGVRILEADGWSRKLTPADVVLVNAGTSRLSPRWLDALPLGGRLVVPLAAREESGEQTMTRGIVLRLERDEEGFDASFVSPVAIYPCYGAEDPDADASLRAAITAGGAHAVTRLVRGAPPDETACWLVGEGWYLT